MPAEHTTPSNPLGQPTPDPPRAPPTIAFLGEHAIRITLPPADPFDEHLRRIHRCADAIRRAAGPALQQIVPTLNTITAHLRPGAILHQHHAETLLARLRAAIDEPAPHHTTGQTPAPVHRLITIPVHYAGPHGPDLRSVAELTGLSESQVIELHASAEYRVAFLGFTPGFTYLIGLPPPLHLPRLNAPRPRVEPGSVAIAGPQSGIYPWPTPGGWRILGRTSLPLFNPLNDPPNALRPGDRVRFVPATTTPTPTPSSPAPPTAPAHPEPHAAPRPTRPTITILQPGLLSTIQDSGRASHAECGVARSGAADRLALRITNRLVGNHDHAAAIEAAAIGPTIRIDHAPATIALAGAHTNATITDRTGTRPLPHARPVRLEPGAIIRLGLAPSGAWSCLAIRGGIDTPIILGSRSTHIPSGLAGPPLQPGQSLPIGPHHEPDPPTHPPAPHAHTTQRRALIDLLRAARTPAIRAIPAAPLEAPTPHAAERRRALERTEFRIDRASDRTGVRLLATPLVHPLWPHDPHDPTEHADEPSQGTVPGAIQRTPQGQLIVLGPDAAPTGGYPIIAVVIDADLDALAQRRPDDILRFTLIDRHAAWHAHHAREAALAIAIPPQRPHTRTPDNQPSPTHPDP